MNMISGGGTTYAESVCVWWGGWNGQLLVAIIIMETISNMQQLSEGDLILQPVIVMQCYTLTT